MRYSLTSIIGLFIIIVSCSEDGTDGLDAQSSLINVSNEPVGNNCANGGVKIETGIDRNLNGTLEADEVQEVTFVCNGESLADKGQTYLVLTGDISNEEAQAKVDEEVGPNTQLIIIKNTLELTTLDIPQAEHLAEIQIDGNRALGTINFPNLTAVDDAIVISDNLSDSLKIKMNALLEVKGNLELINNDVLEVEMNFLEKVSWLKVLGESYVEISLPLLKEALAIEVSENIGDLLFNFPELTDLGDLYLNDNLISSLTLNAPKVTQITFFEVARNDNISGNPLIFNESFGLTTLSDLSYLSFEDNSLFSTLSIPSLENIFSLTITQNNNLASISIDNLIASNSLSVTSNTSLISADFSSLENMGTSFSIYQNPSLTDLNLDAISACSVSSLSFNDNAFNSATVNYILTRLVGISPPLSGITINLQQNSNAPPTGQGLTDKGTLESAGNTVNTD